MAMMLEWSLHPQQTIETESMTALRTSHKLLFKIYDRIRDAPAERAALGLPPRCYAADVGAACARLLGWHLKDGKAQRSLGIQEQLLLT
jgi:hypothetical protein